MLLRFSLRRAGCVSQDAYSLNRLIVNRTRFERKKMGAIIAQLPLLHSALPHTHPWENKKKGGKERKVKGKVVLPLFQLSSLPRVSQAARGALPSSQKSPVALNSLHSRNFGLWATKMKPNLYKPVQLCTQTKN